jgi:hypothetical protein
MMGDLLDGQRSFAEKRRRDAQKVRALAQFGGKVAPPPTPEPPEPTRQLPPVEPEVVEAVSRTERTA